MGNWKNFTSFGVTEFGLGSIAFFLLLAWSLVWKGLALWKAAQKGEKKWFIALLVINTIGILEILYLYVFSKKKKAVEEPANVNV